MDLSLVPLDILVQELLDRHDHAIFMGAKTMAMPDSKQTDIISIRRWKGNAYTCAGLCDSLNRSVLDLFHKSETPIDGGGI